MSIERAESEQRQLKEKRKEKTRKKNRRNNRGKRLNFNPTNQLDFQEAFAFMKALTQGSIQASEHSVFTSDDKRCRVLEIMSIWGECSIVEIEYAVR